MESGTSDRTVVPNQEGDESSMVLDPSIQASLQRTSSVVSKNIAAGDDQSARMESSIPVASSKDSEIIEAEDDPSPGMEPSLDPAKDEQSSETRSTSSPKMKVNPYIEDLSRDKYEKDGLAALYSRLKLKLKNGLVEMEDMHERRSYIFITEAQLREKVQELFYLCEAIEFVISNWRALLKIPIQKKYPPQPNFKADYRRVDIYYLLFIHALSYEIKLRGKLKADHLHSTIVANLSKYFEATDFMVFLINKLQQEEDIMESLLVPQEAKTFLVNKCVHRYEKETIYTFICLVANGEDKVAEDLFEGLFKHMKPSDSINRGRVYNYALQKAQKLLKVRTFLSSPSLSRRYKAIVEDRDRLSRLANEQYKQVELVQNCLVNLCLKDVALKPKIDWEFVEKHDYPYLIQCVWENLQRMEPKDVEPYNWTPLQLNYVFTSSAAMIVGGKKIMDCLLKKWPTLVNAPYKGVAALHVAVFKGNEEAIKCLLKQKDLDINLRTGQLLTANDVNTYLECGKVTKGVKKRKGKEPRYATDLADREELTKDLLRELGIEVNSSNRSEESNKDLCEQRIEVNSSNRSEESIKDLRLRHVQGTKVNLGSHPEDDLAKIIQRIKIFGKKWTGKWNKNKVNLGSHLVDDLAKIIQRIKISGKKWTGKWNKNRWNLPTYQTALHIATAQGDANAVSLLCNVQKPHQQRLRCHEEDEAERTPMDILYQRLESFGKDRESAKIEKTLLRKPEVQSGIDKLYRNRQVLVDAVNTILVVAALIAGVTFAGWLQPPLGYAQYYDLAVPYPAPPDTYDSYLAVRGNLGVKIFALFNSLSFFFAIATIIVGADATFPQPTYTYIGHDVKIMRRLLRRAIKLFIVSLVCVLGAFGSAAIVVLPPNLFFRKDFVLSIFIGGGVCAYVLWQLLSRHFKTMRWLNEFVVNIIKVGNVF